MRRRRGEHWSTETQKNSWHMNFRFLCHVDTAGGVIGNNGTRVKHLEDQTGCRISLEKTLRNCAERVINVTGDAAVERNISITEGVAEPAVVRVTAAQEGLLRVFETVLSLEGNGALVGGAVGCRLLCPSFQIGALIGKRGKTIDAIRRISEAKIKILNNEQLPPCAATDEELIQIMGGVLSVKRALVTVSQCLQDCAIGRRPVIVSSGVDFPPPPASSMSSSLQRPADDFLVGHSVSKYDDSVLRPDEENNQQKVSFRLLCSTNSAGGIIGRSATVTRALENETGASIKFSPPVRGSKYRVAIISSLEKQDPLYPSAQIAIIRVFEKYMEECGLVLGLHKGAIVTAEILVASDELKCLVDEKGQVRADLDSTPGVEMQLSPADLPQNLVAENDQVIQIVGEYFNVKVALFQLTGKLRENFFSTSAIPKDSHDEARLNLASETSLPVESDRLKFVPNLGGPHKLLVNKQINDGADVIEVSSYRTEEIVVPKEKFEFVYGLEVTTLTMLKKSSGAKITVQDPKPGESSGKVMITGTWEQILVAKCLLQAFISIEP